MKIKTRAQIKARSKIRAQQGKHKIKIRAQQGSSTKEK